MSDRVESPSIEEQIENVQRQYDRHAHHLGHIQRIMRQLQKDVEESIEILLKLNEESIDLQKKLNEKKKTEEAKKLAEGFTTGEAV